MRYVIFGGSFDPVHLEHIKIINSAYEIIGPDKIIIVPSYNPPHKSKLSASFEERLEMLKIATKDCSWVIIDKIEQQLALSNSYAYIVIDELTKKYGKPLAYIIGGDSLTNFNKWKNPHCIMEQTTLAVFPRKGYSNNLEISNRIIQKFGGKIEILDKTLDDISSSEIRAMILTGVRRKNSFLNKDIIDYIDKHNLYKELQPLVTKFKEMVSDKLFNHSAETAIYAVRLAARNNVDFCDAFLSGLLHDCAKEESYDREAYVDTPIAVIHQYESAKMAKTFFGITNDDIINSIKYHTTGHPNMSVLSKIVFVADKLEIRRSYPNVTEFRSIAESNLETGFRVILQSVYDCVNRTSTEVDKLTKETILWYNSDN